MLNLVWTFLARRTAPLRLPRREQPPAALDRSTDVRILAFYATAGDIRADGHELICYSVQNARSVRLDPPVEALRPALTRCIEVDPARGNRYRLIAEGFDGREVSEGLEIRVRPALPWITFFAASHKEIQRGDAVTFCYGVKYADSVELQPLAWKLDPVAGNCARFYPKLTREYTLVARGAEGATDQAKFTVTVK